MAKIRCPSCGRRLGDTQRSLDCNFNCRGCKQTVRIKVLVANTTDYFKYRGKENYD